MEIVARRLGEALPGETIESALAPGINALKTFDPPLSALGGATVLGVSPDPVEDVKKFHAKQSLNFTLLADEDHAVCEQYGVWGEKQMYGKTYWGAQRSTCIIGEEVVVQHVIQKASPKTDDDEVLAALADLQPA